jgi:hypothetical protein
MGFYDDGGVKNAVVREIRVSRSIEAAHASSSSGQERVVLRLHPSEVVRRGSSPSKFRQRVHRRPSSIYLVPHTASARHHLRGPAIIALEWARHKSAKMRWR